MSSRNAGHGRIHAVELTRAAMRLHRDGRLTDARPLYDKALRAAPDHPDALHYLGLLHYQLGEVDKAEKLTRRAIAVAPDYPDPYNNLGNMLKEQGRAIEAESLYRKHLELRPDNADAYNNLGVVLKDQGRFEEAVEVYRLALKRAPDSANIHHNLGNALKKLGLYDAALTAYRQAIALDLRHVEAHVNLGRLLYVSGRCDEAAEVYRHWLAVAPGDPIATHMLAACTGEAPVRASDAYVQATFDRFAGSFDEVLARLDYQAPAHVANAVRRLVGEGDGGLDILDAGCGTGLCGPLLRPLARQLCGVDLSPGMLGKASGRGVYDELVEAELVSFLASRPAAWDLVVSADTLCYFGALDAVCASAASSLRSGGSFVFTVEAVEAGGAPAGYRIAPHGRYGHAREYVMRVVENAGFRIIAIDNVILRNEARNPVNGWLVLAAKRPDNVDVAE